MRLIVNLAVRTAVIMLLLPAIDLVSFSGGIGAGILTAFILGLVSVFTRLVFFPMILSARIVGGIFGAATAGKLGVIAVEFAISAFIYAGVLALTSVIVSGVVLYGFWPTVGAGAILAVISTLLRTARSARA